MSSIGVATQATSARAETSVIGRETVWTGGIIRMKIDPVAKAMVFEQNGMNIPYLQFTRSFKGGLVNIFVKTDDTSLIGREVTALATLMVKKLSNGLAYYYLDLEPVPRETELTHRVGFVPEGEGSWTDTDWQVFETPEPTSGLIIFAPPDAKIIPATAPVVPAPVARTDKARSGRSRRAPYQQTPRTSVAPKASGTKEHRPVKKQQHVAVDPSPTDEPYVPSKLAEALAGMTFNFDTQEGAQPRRN